MDEHEHHEHPMQRWHEGKLNVSKDALACERALQITVKINDELIPMAITMSTPGKDVELAIGWLVSEGLLQSIESVVSHSYDNDEVILELRGIDSEKFLSSARSFPISSSCGLCGRTSLDGIEFPATSSSQSSWLESSVLTSLPSALRIAQPVFEITGGLHAAALFDKSGNLLLLCEDVGRHNALDKLVGSMKLQCIQHSPEHILVLSGRIGYELVQKSAMAGIPVIAGLGAPTTLAVEGARTCGLTLIGFLRDNRFNVHTGSWRLA